MSLSKQENFDRERISMRDMQEMSPAELSKLHPFYFEYLRGRDLEKFSMSQLCSFTSEQIKFLKPNQFSRIGSKRLSVWLEYLESLPRVEEEDVIEETLLSKTGKPFKRKKFGAIQTVREALIRAEKIEEKQRKEERIKSRSDGMITDTDIRATIVANKLNVGMLFLQRLAEKGEIQLHKIIGTHVCNKESILHYLRKQRRPAAVLRSDGRPMRTHQYEKIMSKWHELRDSRKGMPELERLEMEQEINLLREQSELIPYEGRFELVELPEVVDIPELKVSDEFADRLNMDRRAFVRSCNEGYFDHWRIGNVVRLSEEDFRNSCERQKMVHMSKHTTPGRKRLVLKND